MLAQMAVGADDASMRPRVFPAEDPGLPLRPGPRYRASMRPRVFPAEDVTTSKQVCHNIAGFNEAAGIPRGRHTYPTCALCAKRTVLQ